MIRIAVVVGGRPNYIKLSPIVKALKSDSRFACIFVDAGQHYSPELRDVFFNDLGLPAPDERLGVGSDTHAQQTAVALIKMEEVIEEVDADVVLVHGDMNYALGCALAAAKLHVPVVHNEAGLRSHDRRMPEEINRILIDDLATNYLFTEQSGEVYLNPTRDAGEFVGSTLPEIMQATFNGPIPVWQPVKERNIVVTLHRSGSVDSKELLRARLQQLDRIQDTHAAAVHFYAHPRTFKRIEEFGLMTEIELRHPADTYCGFLWAMLTSSMVITDSGGIQGETTILGVPCLTWRENTEQPVTVSMGTNRLRDPEIQIVAQVGEMLKNPPVGEIPPKWDGRATARTVRALYRWFKK